ncbi:hypothetical protein KKY53_10930 [Pseudomonas aeruginosa]|uniref:hypothetical protein n=1 Tax=Pseudomonas aeruginosa TaxID=287 RepID=UPI00068BE4BD|nr:hypothetical protein [Pseudomonas aeruginosa]WCV81032.1 hypothetical protein KKY53_10930 [Pseudomonas aeruginosa]HBO0859755.1 hypothetical protein [Pseudomonas aeruginosa]HCE6879307.1 hypothetical protein [Pseudomonas aeruginosa]HDR2971113.1 hypothetical protein [Pseudomonas aeruginosa]
MEIGGLSATSSTRQSKVASAGQRTEEQALPVQVEVSPESSALASALSQPSISDVPEDTRSFDLYRQVSRPNTTEVTARELFRDTGSAYTSVEAAYDKVMKTLVAKEPQLAGKEFGFSVNPQGRLVLTSAGDLTKQQAERVENALNASSQLVGAANRYAQLQIDFVAADNVSMYGKYHLDMDNFAQTVDIGKEINAAKKGDGSWIGKSWFNQISANAEVRYGGWEKFVDGNWVSAPDFKSGGIVSVYA